jgi:radical SAM superfamily enzyme YgiQ (UPF0313 family)
MNESLTAVESRSVFGVHGAVLLVSCYELGHQPLNLASPLGHLRAANIDPVAIDTSVESLADDAIARAKLVAISVPMHTALRLGSRIAERVRKLNPSAHITFYGLYATLNASYLLRQHGDSVISGEYERALTGLAVALAAGRDPTTVPGVGTRNHIAAPTIERLSFVTPERKSLPVLRHYAGLEVDGTIVRAGYVETTRGCHHTCRHCPITPIYGGRFFAIPRETVVADAKAQIEAGARHITFGDPDFFNGPLHGLRIMRELRVSYPWLTFDATIKIEHILQHRRLIPDLAANGCIFVVSAVESLSDAVLTKLDKGHDRGNVVSAIEILDEQRIPMRPSLLPFTPWATLNDYLELLTFFAERDLIEHVDPVHFSIRLLVPPGSALLDDPSSVDWVGELDEEAFTYRWISPDPRMDQLQRRVAHLVEQAAAEHEPARDTFERIWNAAHDVAGMNQIPVLPLVERRSRPPRLTESWFC